MTLNRLKTQRKSITTMQRHKWLSLQDAATLMADEAVTHRPQTTTIAMDAKPTKHTQTLALRKARVIVRFWEGWFGRKGAGAFERAVGGGTVK